MKNKKIVIFLFTLIFAIGMIPMNVFAATNVTPTSTASITVNSAVENDVLAAYKVIDITYDATSNHVSYKWNDDFKDYFAGTTSYNNTACTIEQFEALGSDSAELKSLLAGLPNYIANKSITPVGTQIVAADGTAKFENLAMGEYFIRPTSTTSVYQLMLQKIEPTVDNGKYVIDDVPFTAKHKEAAIEKTADKTSVTKNEKVAYTISVDIPTYAAEATDKTFYVSDFLPDGLTLDIASIKVSANGTDITDQAGTAYTLATTSTAEYTFKLSVDSAQYASKWSANGGKKLVITYTATLNNDNTTAVNAKETNTATFYYSNYPYVENSHKQKTDTAEVTTFAIKIDKYETNHDDTKLAGAKFDLYRTATQAEVDAGTSVTIPHTSVQGIKLECDLVTDVNGTATFAKYEANGDNYDYYLVETQAPSGYNILSNAVQVNFSDADVAKTEGVYTVQVPNSAGITLPITGGAGTVLFTVIGIAFMAGAVILFVISRKKVKVNNK
ncbi:MAG: SpaH/EbpB family LPXTG-anchored major pilin [Ruminococcus sp.]